MFYLELKTGLKVAPSQLLLLVLSLWCYLSYIVLINDVADRKVDAAAGKATIGRGHSVRRGYLIAVLVVLVLIGSFVNFVELHGNIVFDFVWFLAYVLGTLYSLPPFSLKERGVLGFLADSLIEKPLPILVVFSYFNYFGPEVVLFPIIGEMLDSIFKHQAHDYDIDVKEGIRTFAVVLGKKTSDALVKKILYPLNAASVVLAFLFVIFEIQGLAQIAGYFLAFIVVALVLIFLRLGKLIFQQGTLSWIERRIKDPLYTFLLNSGYLLFLLPVIGFDLAFKDSSFIPILVLSLISIALQFGSALIVAVYGFKKIF